MSAKTHKLPGQRILQHSLLAVALWALSSPASALSLSEIKLSSGLHQPFKARIALRNFDPVEADRITVQIADDRIQSQYNNSNYLPAPLKAAIKTTKQGSYIELSSPQAIDEPFLKFAVQLDSPDGLILRQYEVLLDPPASVYALHKQQPASPAPPVAQALRHAPAAHLISKADTDAGIELAPGTELETLALLEALTKPSETPKAQEVKLKPKQTAIAPIMRHALAAPSSVNQERVPAKAALQISPVPASKKTNKAYSSQTLSQAEFLAALQALPGADNTAPASLKPQAKAPPAEVIKTRPVTAALSVKAPGKTRMIRKATVPARATASTARPGALDSRVFASNRADVVAQALMDYKERLRNGEKPTMHRRELVKMSASGVKRVSTLKTP